MPERIWFDWLCYGIVVRGVWLCSCIHNREPVDLDGSVMCRYMKWCHCFKLILYIEGMSSFSVNMFCCEMDIFVIVMCCCYLLMTYMYLFVCDED